MHYYLWHNKEQSGTLCSSPMSPSSQATTPGFISSHGGGSDITSSQKSAQRGCMEAIKWFFWAQNLVDPKSCGKNQLKPFSDIFESPESEYEVTFVQKKFSQALENMRALVVHNCTMQISTTWGGKILVCLPTMSMHALHFVGLISTTKSNTGACELSYQQWQDFSNSTPAWLSTPLPPPLDIFLHLLPTYIHCTITTTDTKAYNHKPWGKCAEMVDIMWKHMGTMSQGVMMGVSHMWLVRDIPKSGLGTSTSGCQEAK